MHAFLSYVHEDAAIVEQIATTLSNRGIHVWLDKEQIKPGERWAIAIRNAIEDGAYFVACFSTSYEQRSRTYMNEELLLAIGELRKRPIDRAWFIPIRLDDCRIPDLEIGPVDTLNAIQRIDLFPDLDGPLLQLADALDPTGHARKWSGPLRGIAFEDDSELGCGYLPILAEHLCKFDISLDIFGRGDGFLNKLWSEQNQYDFVLAETLGTNARSLEYSVQLLRFISEKIPRLECVLFTRYESRRHGALDDAADTYLVKSQRLSPSWAAEELHVDLRRLIREKNS